MLEKLNSSFINIPDFVSDKMKNSRFGSIEWLRLDNSWSWPEFKNLKGDLITLRHSFSIETGNPALRIPLGTLRPFQHQLHSHWDLKLRLWQVTLRTSTSALTDDTASCSLQRPKSVFYTFDTVKHWNIEWKVLNVSVLSVWDGLKRRSVTCLTDKRCHHSVIPVSQQHLAADNALSSRYHSGAVL